MKAKTQAVVHIERLDMHDYVIDVDCTAAPHEIARLLRTLARAVEILHPEVGA